MRVDPIFSNAMGFRIIKFCPSFPGLSKIETAELPKCALGVTRRESLVHENATFDIIGTARFQRSRNRLHTRAVHETPNRFCNRSRLPLLTQFKTLRQAVQTCRLPRGYFLRAERHPFEQLIQRCVCTLQCQIS